MMKIQFVDESEFAKIDSTRQVIAHDRACKFATLDLGENLGCYGISWRSDSLDPIVKKSSNESEVWIGIDLQLAAINLYNGRIIVAMPFTTYIVQILAVDSAMTVLTEGEVLLFNPGGAIRFSDALPDLGIGMTVEGENLVIKMLEGESLTINPMMGYFKESTPALR